MRGRTFGQPLHGLADGVVLLGYAIGREHLGRCRLGGCGRGLQLGHIGALALLGRNDACRNAHGRRAGGHGLDDHGIAADLGTIAHLEAAQHLGTRGHDHVLAQGGMALGALVQRGTAQGDAVVDGAAVADHRRLADHHAHTVVNEDALANHRAGVDFNAGQPAAKVRSEATQPLEVVRPAPVRRTVPPDGMQTRITGNDLPGAARRRVAVKNALDVRTQSGKHQRPSLVTKRAASLVLWGRALQHAFGNTAQDVDFFLRQLRTVEHLVQARHQLLGRSRVQKA